jgi:hypothetical protein
MTKNTWKSVQCGKGGKKKERKEKKRIKINTYTHNPDILRWVGTLWKTEEIKILDRDILTAYEVLKLSINTTLYRKQMRLAEIKNKKYILWLGKEKDWYIQVTPKWSQRLKPIWQI